MSCPDAVARCVVSPCTTIASIANCCAERPSESVAWAAAWRHRARRVARRWRATIRSYRCAGDATVSSLPKTAAASRRRGRSAAETAMRVRVRSTAPASASRPSARAAPRDVFAVTRVPRVGCQRSIGCDIDAFDRLVLLHDSRDEQVGRSRRRTRHGSRPRRGPRIAVFGQRQHRRLLGGQVEIGMPARSAASASGSAVSRYGAR